MTSTILLVAIFHFLEIQAAWVCSFTDLFLGRKAVFKSSLILSFPKPSLQFIAAAFVLVAQLVWGQPINSCTEIVSLQNKIVFSIMLFVTQVSLVRATRQRAMRLSSAVGLIWITFIFDLCTWLCKNNKMKSFSSYAEERSTGRKHS